MANTNEQQPKLTASALKDALWTTLQDLKSDKCEPGKADSIATQGREILRTVNTQLKVSAASGRAVPVEVIAFSENAV